jgi:hypothetical protein
MAQIGRGGEPQHRLEWEEDGQDTVGESGVPSLLRGLL